MNGFRKDVEKEIKKMKASEPSDVVKESKKKEPTPTTVYRVQVGSFTHLKYAKELRQQMINKGYDAIIIQSGNLYKVQVGAYTNKDNTDIICKKLRKDDIKYVITTESIVIVKD
jgi:cell division protein FtsN